MLDVVQMENLFIFLSVAGLDADSRISDNCQLLTAFWTGIIMKMLVEWFELFLPFPLPEKAWGRIILWFVLAICTEENANA